MRKLLLSSSPSFSPCPPPPRPKKPRADGVWGLTGEKCRWFWMKLFKTFSFCCCSNMPLDIRCADLVVRVTDWVTNDGAFLYLLLLLLLSFSQFSLLLFPSLLLYPGRSLHCPPPPPSLVRVIHRLDASRKPLWQSHRLSEPRDLSRLIFPSLHRPTPSRRHPPSRKNPTRSVWSFISKFTGGAAARAKQEKSLSWFASPNSTWFSPC